MNRPVPVCGVSSVEERRVLDGIQACHPFQAAPVVLDVGTVCPTLEQIQESCLRLRQLCSPGTEWAAAVCCRCMLSTLIIQIDVVWQDLCWTYSFKILIILFRLGLCLFLEIFMVFVLNSLQIMSLCLV